MKSKFISVAVMATVAVIMMSDWAAAREISTPYVVVDGRRIHGSSVRADRSGQIILTTETGRMTFDRGTRVVVDEPPDFAGLRRKVSEGKYSEAVPGLNDVISRYRFLGWDNEARRFLGRALVGMERFDAAVRNFEELFEDHPAAREHPDAQEYYMFALEGAGESEKLLPLLEAVIRRGERRTAARAQIMRGNLRLADGNKEEALYDFLRTATMFRGVIEVQPEAVYRTAEAYEALGFNEQAEEYYERLRKDFPQSEFAGRIR